MEDDDEIDMRIHPLKGAIPFGTPTPQMPSPTGKINIRANININVDTGDILITDEKNRISFKFNDKNRAKKWADACR